EVGRIERVDVDAAEDHRHRDEDAGRVDGRQQHADGRVGQRDPLIGGFHSPHPSRAEAARASSTRRRSDNVSWRRSSLVIASTALWMLVPRMTLNSPISLSPAGWKLTWNRRLFSDS